MKFRKWVSITLVIINIFAVIIMASECDDLKMFITSKIIATNIFILNNMLLMKYGGLKDE